MQNWVTTKQYKHPMFDQIRRHSTAPDEACEFFMRLLSPHPADRLGVDYRQLPYLGSVYNEMQTALILRGKPCHCHAHHQTEMTVPPLLLLL